MPDIMMLLVEAKPIASVLHYFAFAIGIGTASFCDVFVLKLMARRRVRKQAVATIYLAHKVLLGSLVVIWVTGLLHLVRLAETDPEGLENPKLWAKIIIFAVVSVNGLVIQKWCLPWLHRRMGQALLAGTSWTARVGFASTGAISATSWFFVLALGALEVINHVTPLPALMAVYAVCLAGAFVVSSLMIFRGARLIRPVGRPMRAAVADSSPST